LEFRVSVLSGKGVAVILTLILTVAISSSFFLPREQFAFIDDLDVKVKDVEDDLVDLTFLIRLRCTELNFTLKVSVYDLKTGILLNEIEYPIYGRNMNVTMSFEKDRDYRVRIAVKRADKTFDTREVNLKYLNTLIPERKKLKVILKDVDFKVVGVDERVDVTVRFYFDSLRDYDVKFHVKAVQFESNVLTDEVWVGKRLEGGKTNVVEVNLSVVREYNYLIKLEAWRNGSIVKVWREVLNLAPKKVVPKEEVEEEVKFEVEKFLTRTPVPETVKTYPTPGFEFLTLIASGGVVICLRIMLRRF